MTMISEKLLSDTDVRIVMLHQKLKMWGGKFICPIILFIFKAIGISGSLFLHLLFCGILALNYASFASVSSICNFHFSVSTHVGK